MNKKVVLPITLLLALAIAFSAAFTTARPVHATSFDDDGVVEADEVIDDDLILGGDQVEMAGTVNGLLLVAGQNVVITGVVNGDVIATGRTITIAEGAVVTGNLFAGAQNVEVEGMVQGSAATGAASMILGEAAQVMRNVYAGGYSIEAESGSQIGQDIYASGYQTLLSGVVGRDASLSAAAVELNGSIGRNVQIDVEATTATPPTMYFNGMDLPDPVPSGLRVSPDATVGGQLTYTSPVDQADAIQSEPQGGLVYQTPVPGEGDTPPTVSQDNEDVNPAPVVIVAPVFKWLVDFVRRLGTLLVLGLLAVWLAPRLLALLTGVARERPAQSAGWGLLSIVVVYAVAALAVILLLSFGVFLAIITLGGLARLIFGVGFTALAFGVAVFSALLGYGSKLVIAYLIGDMILVNVPADRKGRAVWAMLIGVVLYTLVRSIPILGWAIGIVVTLVGLGAMYLLYRGWRRPAAVIVAG